MTESLLRVDNLSKNFDRLPVLKDVTFSIQQGEVIGLVGRQGAGTDRGLRRPSRTGGRQRRRRLSFRAGKPREPRRRATQRGRKETTALGSTTRRPPTTDHRGGPQGTQHA